MSLLVVGSIAFDTIETQMGKADSILGGSAIYFSYSASFFKHVNLVGVVGEDFAMEELEFLKARKVGLLGLKVEKGKTFRWHGRYHKDMCGRDTIAVELNTFGSFQPKIPKEYKKSKYVFLANASPQLQQSVLDQIARPKFVVCDTMDYWIEHEKKALLKLIKNIDGLIVNNEEVLQLTGMYHLIGAAREILKWGPKLLIVKKGEHGALLITKKDFFAIPGYPVEVVRDPTGAGDSFAGGMMGYLAQAPDLSFKTIKKALLHGNVIASFTIEDFGLERLKRTASREVKSRYKNLTRMMTV
ncbi:MAG: sugar kinase [Planctomycetes bacterium]|nr:sugar kinase [Planctomycetota bacterium]